MKRIQETATQPSLPQNRTESGKRKFDLQGAKFFNNLPKKVWDEGFLVFFKHKPKSVAKTLLTARLINMN